MATPPETPEVSDETSEPAATEELAPSPTARSRATRGRGRRTPPGLLLLLMLAFLAVGTFILYSEFQKRRGLPQSPMDLSSRQTPLVVDIDLDALLGSPAYDALVTQLGGDRGLRMLEERCGQSPLDGISRLVVFAQGDNETLQHIGFAAEGDFDREALSRCATLAVEDDGGALQETELDGVPALRPERGDSVIAFVGPRALVGGEVSVVRDSIRVIQGSASPMAAQSQRDLYARVAPNRQVRLVATLPDRYRREAARTLSEALASEDSEPLAEGPVAVGAGLNVERGLALGAVILFEAESDADWLAARIRERAASLLAHPLVSLSSLAPVLRRLEVEAQGRELVLSVAAEESELQSLAEFIRQRVLAPG